MNPPETPSPHPPQSVAEASPGEARLMGAMVAALLRRPLLAPESSSTVFVPMAASRTEWMIPVVLLAMAVEGTALHLLLYGFGARSPWLHGLLMALSRCARTRSGARYSRAEGRRTRG